MPKTVSNKHKSITVPVPTLYLNDCLETGIPSFGLLPRIHFDSSISMNSLRYLNG